MPNVDDIYSSGGTYLKGEDLVGCDDMEVTISGVEIKEFENKGRVDRKAVISFEEMDRVLVVNFKNQATICEVTGTKETDEWIGQTITLYSTKDSYGGKVWDVIRIRPPAPKKTGKKPAFVKKHDERNPPPADDMDDGIPF